MAFSQEIRSYSFHKCLFSVFFPIEITFSSTRFMFKSYLNSNLSGIWCEFELLNSNFAWNSYHTQLQITIQSFDFHGLVYAEIGPTNFDLISGFRYFFHYYRHIDFSTFLKALRRKVYTTKRGHLQKRAKHLATT